MRTSSRRCLALLLLAPLVGCGGSGGGAAGAGSTWEFSPEIAPFASPETLLAPARGRALMALAQGSAVAATNQCVVHVLPESTAEERQAVYAAVAAGGGRFVGQIPGTHALQVEAATNAEIAALQAVLRPLPGVLDVNPNLLVELAVAPTPDVRGEAGGWWIDAIGAPAAWDLVEAAVARSPGPLPAAGIVDTGLRLAAGHFAAGRDVRWVGPPAADLDDVAGHGTATAGLVGAHGLDGVCSVGLAWHNPLLIADVDLGTPGDVFALTAEAGLEAVLRAGARVVNASFGVPRCDRQLPPTCLSEAQYRFVRRSWRSLLTGVMLLAARLDALVTWAAGNDAVSEDELLPEDASAQALAAWRNNGLVVAATTRSAERALFSNFGALVDLGAPGAEIALADNDRDLLGGVQCTTGEGTSFAAPLVTGTALLMLTVAPHLSAPEVKQLLLHAATTPGTWDPAQMGRGLLDAGRAVALAASTVPQEYLGSPRLTATGALGEARTGDLDGDRLTDFVATLPARGEVEVRLGRPGGLFGPPLTYATGGTQPGPCALGDIDGDGDLDLLVGNDGSQDLSILINNGAGAFEPYADRFLPTDPPGPQASPLAVRATALALSDLDGDRRADLLLVDRATSLLHVRLADGEGGFPAAAPGSPYATGAGPVRLAVGFLDLDGSPDVAVAGFDADAVSTYRGRGDGTFEAMTTEPSGLATYGGPDQLVIGHLTGDSRGEIVVGNARSRTVSVLQQDPATPAMRFVGARDWDFPGSPGPLVLEHLDEDGFADLATVNPATGEAVVWFLDGRLTLRDERIFPAGRDPTALCAARVDGDARIDLLVGHGAFHAFSVLRNAGGRAFEVRRDLLVTSDPADVAPFHSVIAALDDVPGDDVAVVTQGGQELLVFRNSDGHGLLSLAQRLPTGAQPLGVAAGDVTGDGLNDLVTANFSAGSVSVFAGDGRGSFTALGETAVGGQALRVEALDLDGVSPLEIVVCSYFPSSVQVLRASSTTPGAFDLVGTFGAGRIGLPHHMAAGDVNGDGRPDLALSQYFAGSVAVFFGDGTGGFGDVPVVYGGLLEPIMTCIEDLNEDGYGDVVAYGGSGGSIAFGAAGTPVLAVGATFDAGHHGTNTGIPASGDFDGDGHRDLAYPDTGQFWSADRPPSDSLILLHGDGRGAFPRRSAYAVAPGATGAAAGDLNQDGKPDFVTCSAGPASAGPLRRTLSILLHR